MANNGGGVSFALGFLVGGIAGIAAGLLLAPRTGSDTRAEIAGQSEAWRNRAEEMAANFRDRVGPTMDSARERVYPTIDAARERGVTAVDSARERINPAVEGVRERVSPIVDQVNTRLGRATVPEDSVADPMPESPSKNGGLEQEEERA